MSSPAQPAVPEHVIENIEMAAAALKARLFRLYELGAPFKLWAEVEGETCAGGALARKITWYEDVRQQMPGPPRRRAG